MIRFPLWCLVNFVLWPLLRRGAKRFHLFKFLFVVYPGTKNNIRAYAPMWFQRIFKDILHLSIIGVMTRGEGPGRGLIVTLSGAPDTLTKKELQEISDRIKEFGEKIGVSSIALAGRLPALFEANDCLLIPPFIKGEKGAVFTIIETYLYLLEKTGIKLNDPVGVVGVGYLGSKVTTRLGEIGCGSIIGYDIRLKRTTIRGAITRTNDPTLLAGCKMIIVLTPKGEDMAGVLSWLKEDVVIIDDTHPQIPPALISTIILKGGTVYQSAMGIKGVRSIPRLPGFSPEWIPGCVVESLVGLDGATQEAFDEEGRKIGLTPFLTSPRGEG